MRQIRRITVVRCLLTPRCQHRLYSIDVPLSRRKTMNTNVVEIVKWKSASGVTDRATIDAAQALVPDLKTVGGFIEKTLYKNGDEWVDIYYWETIEDAQLSNERMAGKASLGKLFSLVQPESVSITVMRKA